MVQMYGLFENLQINLCRKWQTDRSALLILRGREIFPILRHHLKFCNNEKTFICPVFRSSAPVRLHL